jgi:AcrR family transcriptional regulator
VPESTTPTGRRLGRPRKNAGTAAVPAGEALLKAALAEFVEFGFDGTHTNRISERAGFAPQTFYRWYKDKLSVFIAVLDHWAESDMAQLIALLSEDQSSLQLAEACVEAHRGLMTFKRSIKRLAQDLPEVRHAVTQARLRQMDCVQKLNPALDQESIAALLIGLAQWCEALAEGEFTDLGLQGRKGYEQLAQLIDQLRHR